MIEALLNEPYWVIDFLPEQVPEGSAGQVFAIEKFFLRPSMMNDPHRRFLHILLKLNCYADFQVSAPDKEEATFNPPPE